MTFQRADAPWSMKVIIPCGYNLVAGKWDIKRGEKTAVFYHHEHGYNIEEMSLALDSALKYYSEWFGPYPWKELKLSEFPGLAYYAQGFPTNITFSEAMGFLIKSDPDSNVAFAFTAHEASHQWWGNLLLPGEGPGGNVIAEGMAHFSTILLLDQVKGERASESFRRSIENQYGENRRVDSERPLVFVDGGKSGDVDLMYNRGSWCYFMLMEQMGKDAILAGLRGFISEYQDNQDFPVLHDLLAFLRNYSSDPDGYDALTDQLFRKVSVPEYKLYDVLVEPLADGVSWQLKARIKNIGTGSFPVEISAMQGEEYPDESGDKMEEEDSYKEERIEVLLGPGDSERIVIPCDFIPEKVVVDPDVKVLQLNRKLAVGYVKNKSY